MLILGRTLAGDAADQNIARELIKQYTLTPTGATGPNNAVLPANNSGIAYLNGISDAITLNPPPAEDDPILATLAKIGCGTESSGFSTPTSCREALREATDGASELMPLEEDNG